jgi:hypothetical protein
MHPAGKQKLYAFLTSATLFDVKYISLVLI